MRRQLDITITNLWRHKAQVPQFKKKGGGEDWASIAWVWSIDWLIDWLNSFIRSSLTQYMVKWYTQIKVLYIKHRVMSTYTPRGNSNYQHAVLWFNGEYHLKSCSSYFVSEKKSEQPCMVYRRLLHCNKYITLFLIILSFWWCKIITVARILNSSTDVNPAR